MTVLIDSWAWIEYFKGTNFGKKAKEYIENNEEIIVSSINVAEIYNFLLTNKPKDAENLINFVIGSSFIVPLTAELSLKAAEYKHRKKFGMADAIVLATAEQHNCKIVTGDDDFIKESNVIFIGGKD